MYLKEPSDSMNHHGRASPPYRNLPEGELWEQKSRQERLGAGVVNTAGEVPGPKTPSLSINPSPDPP